MKSTQVAALVRRLKTNTERATARAVARSQSSPKRKEVVDAVIPDEIPPIQQQQAAITAECRRVWCPQP